MILPANVDTNLILLVGALLNKDNSYRPNINEVTNIPCVSKAEVTFLILKITRGIL
jgi:hypothetical protein